MIIMNKNFCMFDTYNTVDVNVLDGCTIYKSLSDMYKHNDRLTGCHIGAKGNEIFIADNGELYHQSKPMHESVNGSIESFINNYEFI